MSSSVYLDEGNNLLKHDPFCVEVFQWDVLISLDLEECDQLKSHIESR